jgi:hypothetical protein
MTGAVHQPRRPGPRMVLLHSGLLSGELCWSRQLPLADRLALEIVDRAGYGRSQEVSPGEDLDADAQLVAGLLEGSAPRGPLVRCGGRDAGRRARAPGGAVADLVRTVGLPARPRLIQSSANGTRPPVARPGDWCGSSPWMEQRPEKPMALRRHDLRLRPGECCFWGAYGEQPRRHHCGTAGQRGMPALS